MKNIQLFVNSLSFRYPTEPVTCYFSTQNDNENKSDELKSIELVPNEVINILSCKKLVVFKRILATELYISYTQVLCAWNTPLSDL